MGCEDGVKTLSSEQPSNDVVEEPPPPPPPPEPETKAPDASAQKPSEEAWKEDYDEMITPEKPTKPQKKRHWGGIIVVAIVLILLLVWTILSPDVMPQESDKYTTSPTYANLGNYTGYRHIWAGNMTWGISIRGPTSVVAGTPMVITVLVTKIYEQPGNWFFRGTSVDLKNVSVFKLDGTYLASMSNSTDLGFGVSATVNLNITQSGNCSLYVYVKFTVYEMMRIGFMPLETVQVTPGVDLKQITVT